MLDRCPGGQKGQKGTKEWVATLDRATWDPLHVLRNRPYHKIRNGEQIALRTVFMILRCQTTCSAQMDAIW